MLAYNSIKWHLDHHLIFTVNYTNIVVYVDRTDSMECVDSRMPLKLLRSPECVALRAHTSFHACIQAVTRIPSLVRL